MKVDANGNPIVEDETQNKNEPAAGNENQNNELKGNEGSQGNGNENKNTNSNNNNVGSNNAGSKDSEDDENNKPVDKEALKAEILAEMGLDASQVEKFKKFSSLFSGKDDDDNKKTPDEKITELERRTELAELKADLMQQGVLPAYIEDAVTLIGAKKAGDKQFNMKNTIIEFKNRYPEWFTSEEGTGKKNFTGTGSSVKGKNSGAENKDEKGLGARLAASKKPAAGKKSSYWGK